jgi:hypothetical protein
MSQDMISEFRKFGLKPAGALNQIFENEICLAATAIRKIQYDCSFDHRPFLPERDRAFAYLLTEEYRRGYACFKFAVSAFLKPEKIVEIGVGAGTGAIAMLSASPEAHYIGFDDESKSRNDGWDFIGFVKSQLGALKFSHEIRIQDSMKTADLHVGMPDLVHVDGDHHYENAKNDFTLALHTGCKWILVDDAKDGEVVRGVFDALQIWARGHYEWAFFDDTWTGNLLFCRKARD